MAARRYGSSAADDAPAAPKIKAKNDVYTGLLALALLGMLVSCTLLLLDYLQYGGELPPKSPIAKEKDVKPSKDAPK